MIAGLLIVTVAIGSFLGGFLFAFWRLNRARREIREAWLNSGRITDIYADKLEQDETRLGINHGITYAAGKMQMTLNELYDHVKETEHEH